MPGILIRVPHIRNVFQDLLVQEIIRGEVQLCTGLGKKGSK
jgi:hypothetical protein